MRWMRGIAAAGLLLAGCATTSDDDRRLAYTHRQLGEVKLSQGEVEMAVAEFRRSIALDPHDPETHFGLAEAYRYKGLLVEAEQELQQTIALRPGHGDARLNLGVVYLMQERWAEAIGVFEQLAEDPTFIRPSRALVNLGWAQYKSGNIAAARNSLERALRTDRGNHVAHLNLGIVLYDQGELVGSIQQFDAVLGILANRPAALFAATEAEARFRKAQAYVKLGKRAEAIAELQAASQRGGPTEWARKSEEYLQVLR
jgi:type IV pilus assembly protein PilF